MKFKKIKKEWWLLGLVWLIGLFVRVYRQGDLLGFYYDQGRDALKVMDILSFRDLPAIGPTTGLSGIYLGPFWFYFLAPLYALGHGNPAVAAALVGAVDSFSIILIYLLGKKHFNKRVGLGAATLWAFSYGLVRSARWFSNPSPLPFFFLLLVYGLSKWWFGKKDKWIWVVFLCLALALQLEAASAIFYFPAILILVWLKKLRVKPLLRSKNFKIGVGVFLASFLPQLAFEFKNGFLTFKNLLGFLTGKVNADGGKSWALPTLELIKLRITDYYYVTFFSKIEFDLEWVGIIALFFLLWWLADLFLSLKKKEFSFKVVLGIFLFTPLVSLFFFVGNYGNLYDYYLTGFFPAFILLFACFLDFFARKLIWIVLPVFWLVFLKDNGVLLKNYLVAGVDGPTHISLGNQKQIIEWVCEQKGEAPFNVDVYVPPVIPYAWDYLWEWHGCCNLGCCPSQERTSALYTIYEIDPPHPERLGAWFKRQDGIGEINQEVKFGGIGARERGRVNE